MFIAHNFQISHVKRRVFVLILETMKRINEALAEHGESNFRVLCSFRKPLPDSMTQKPALVSRLGNLLGQPGRPRVLPGCLCPPGSGSGEGAGVICGSSHGKGRYTQPWMSEAEIKSQNLFSKQAAFCSIKVQVDRCKG